MQNRELASQQAARLPAPKAVRVTGFRPSMCAFSTIASAACLFLCLALVSCIGGFHSLPNLPPNFSFTAMPSSVTLVAGGMGQPVAIDAFQVINFTGTVEVTISGLPSGVTANPSTLSLTPGIAQNVVLTASLTATPGNATVTVKGTAGSTSHTVNIAVTISAPPPPEVSLTVSPTSLTLVAGTSGSKVSVLATAVNSFSGTVAIAITGLPSGVTASPATLSLTPGTAQKVTLTAASAAAVGSATVTLTGTSGTLSHSATVALTISAAPPPPEFSLTVSPTSLTLVAGTSGSQVSVLATAVNSFSGTVAVAITGLPSGVTASPATLSLTPGTAQNVTLTAASAAAPGSPTVTFTGTSGTLSHSATVALTISAASPPPEFSLTVSPTSLTLVAGTSGSKVSVLATAVNSFSGTVAIAITGLPSGVTASPATLTLTPGTAQSTTLTAASSAAASTSTVTFTGVSGNLSHSAPLALTVQATVSTTNAPDVTTYHYDLARDGLNAQETVLTLSNVNSTQFGKIGFDTVDGLVDAQPLYLANVTAGGKLRNVLYVATEHDSVYAFDADSGVQIWKTSVLGSGETTSDNRGCTQVTPEIGITSTPVIDRKLGADGALFTVGMSKDASGIYHQRLHALDIVTGAEIGGSPVEISASYPGTGDSTTNGNVIFEPGQYKERAALLLLNGNVYLGWSSHCDFRPYTGWVMAYDESSLQQAQVLNLTPNGSEGSVWMSGDGMAADSSGNLYFLDANGTFDTTLDTNGFPAHNDFGNAMIKLSTSGALAVADYFETYNTVTESDADEDLGSGGEVLLPDQMDAGGVVHHLVVGAGKDSNVYLADRDNMGGFSATGPIDSNIYQEVIGALSGEVFSTPAFFNGVLYYGAVGDALKALPLTNAMLATTPSSQSAATFAYPGTTPSVSANGTQNGIVWALESSMSASGVLHAYDAASLTHELYNSGQAANARDSFGNGNKYITPMVVNGKVYVGTQTGVAVFGLLSQ